MFRKSEEAARTILESCDENNDGYIDFAEFRQIVSTVEKLNELPPSNEELLYAFEQFDTDGNHLICYREFWKRLKALDPSMSRKEADLVFN
jgi:Ca2+-binding EF-hand superfamily protein